MKAAHKEKKGLESKNPEIALGVFIAEAKMHEQKLLQSICDLSCNYIQCEEVLRKVMDRFICYLADSRAKTALFPWLLQTAMDESIESLLQQGPESVSSSRSYIKTLFTRCPAASTSISRALMALPVELHDVVRWRDLYGFSIEEVADILLITPFEVLAKSNRARHLIRRQLPKLLAPRNSLDAPMAAEL